MATPPTEPDQLDRELEIELLTELALARAEREGAAVRERAKRWGRIRFIAVAVVLAAIAGTFIYLSLQALRDAFGA